MSTDYQDMNQQRDSEASEIEQSLLNVPGIDEPESKNHFELPPEGSWRRNLLKILISPKFEIFLLILLFLDVIMVITELEISQNTVAMIEFKEFEIESASAGEGGGESGGGGGGETAAATSTLAPTSESTPKYIIENSSIFVNPINCTEAPKIMLTTENHKRDFQLPIKYAACPFTVVKELPHHLEIAEHAVAWISRSIIIFFGLELLALFVAGGPAIYLHHKLYILDAFIVGISIILDGVAVTVEVSSLAELIVIARCWRFARVLHGAAAGSHQAGEQKKHGEEGEGEDGEHDDSGEQGDDNNSIENQSEELSPKTSEKTTN